MLQCQNSDALALKRQDREQDRTNLPSQPLSLRSQLDVLLIHESWHFHDIFDRTTEYIRENAIPHPIVAAFPFPYQTVLLSHRVNRVTQCENHTANMQIISQQKFASRQRGLCHMSFEAVDRYECQNFETERSEIPQFATFSPAHSKLSESLHSFSFRAKTTRIHQRVLAFTNRIADTTKDISTLDRKSREPHWTGIRMADGQNVWFGERK
jgi:hypothetical protein